MPRLTSSAPPSRSENSDNSLCKAIASSCRLAYRGNVVVEGIVTSPIEVYRADVPMEVNRSVVRDAKVPQIC